MADENPLLQHPFFAPSSTTPERPRELTIRLHEANKPLPPEPTGRDIAQDVRKSLVAEGARGVAGAAMGAPGSVESFVVKDIPEMVRGVGLWAGEKMDLISPDERDKMNATPLPWIGEQDKVQQEGHASPIMHWPTYKGVADTFKPLMQDVGVPSMAYKPTTTAGKVVGAAAEMAGQNILGGVATAPARLLTGAGAGAGSEIAKLSSDSPEQDQTRGLVGALAGGLGTGAAVGVAGKLLGAVRGMVTPGSVAERELIEALSTDIRRGQSAMTPVELQEAVSRGALMSVADMGGPETRALLGRYGGKSDDLAGQISTRNEAKLAREMDAGPRLTQGFENVMGGPINAPVLQEAVAASGKIERDQLYNLVRSTPQAQAIDEATFTALMQRPHFQEAMRKAEQAAMEDPSLGIVVPQRTPAVAGNPSTWRQTPQGLRQTPATPAQVIPGNLSYWDQVQRELRQMSDKELAGRGNIEAAAIGKSRTALLRDLDNIPGYTSVRGRAYETFQAADAPSAGYKFFGNMIAFKRHELDNAMSSMTGEQRELFATGFMHAMNDAAQKGQVSSLVKKVTSDHDFQERARRVLGPERFKSVVGEVLSEDAIRGASKLAAIVQPSTLSHVGAAAGEGAIAGAALEAGMMGAQISSSMMMKAAMGAAIAATGRVALDATERKVAARILPLALSTDPNDVRRLGMMAQQNRSVAPLLGKITTAIQSAITASQPGYGGAREGRAAGGAVNLMALANMARKAVTKSTENLLRAPDEHVVKALEVANRQI